jgi:cell division protein ZapE
VAETAISSSEEFSDLPENLNVLEHYQLNLEKRGFIADDAQYQAVLQLQQLYDDFVKFKSKRRTKLGKLLSRATPPKGIYFWGGVGRGKSFLMDSFYTCVPLVRKRRVHFHQFMREIHHEFETLKNISDPLMEIADRIVKKYRLICFDEFHVNDIADAMILSRLLHVLIERGVVFCMTSNYKPDDLYPNGLQRINFLPTIEFIKDKLNVVRVDSGVDYRFRALEKIEVYHAPINAETEQRLNTAFDEIRESADDPSNELLIEGRIIHAKRSASGVVWFEFAELCGGPRSQNDYLELAKRFHTVLLSNIPIMKPNMASEARRFTWLIDVFYDHKVKLILSAEGPPEALYIQGVNSQEFPRTVSRIIEMQSRLYMAQPHQG